MAESVEQKEHDGDTVESGRHDEHDGRDKSFEITVVYNGLTKPLVVSKAELVSSVLAQAIAAFGSLPAPHTLALYNDEGRELPDGESVKDAKLKEGDRLLLRPSTVKAG